MTSLDKSEVIQLVTNWIGEIYKEDSNISMFELRYKLFTKWNDVIGLTNQNDYINAIIEEYEKWVS